jgi:hypothetical protein
MNERNKDCELKITSQFIPQNLSFSLVKIMIVLSRN